MKKTKDKTKDSQLLIRIDKSMRDDFLTICEKKNTKAAKELRKFIAQYIERDKELLDKK